MSHEESQLNRYLTKKDMGLLLETAHISLKNEEADPMRSAFRKLQDLIPFEYGFIVRTRLVSGKEMEFDFVFLSLKEGKTSWEISMILDISERTVNFHVTNLMRKLDATKRMQAVAVALSQGIIEL